MEDFAGVILSIMLDFFNFLLIGFVLAFVARVLASNLWTVGADSVLVGLGGGTGSDLLLLARRRAGRRKVFMMTVLMSRWPLVPWR